MKTKHKYIVMSAFAFGPVWKDVGDELRLTDEEAKYRGAEIQRVVTTPKARRAKGVAKAATPGEAA